MSNPKNVAQRLQLVAMALRYSLDEPPAASGETNFDAAGVGSATALADQVQADATANQGSGAVRTRLKTLGQLPHGRPISIEKTSNVKQQQILGRHYAGST